MRDLSGDLAVLRAIARASQGERSVPEMLLRICEEIKDGFEFDRVGITRLLPDGQSVVPAALAGIDDNALSPRLTLAESPLLEEAHRTQRLAFVADARGHG